MGDGTGIEWTEATWNVVVGCSRVSPGCDNCYAEKQAATRLAHTAAYRGITANGAWTGEVRFLRDRLDQPLRWRRPRLIFVNSMSDLFHPDVPSDTVCQIYEVMGQASQHTFQVLTKRPQRMKELLSLNLPDPLRNVWAGVSIESQQYEFRARHLLDTPAAIRFVSAEPLLGPLDLSPYLGGYYPVDGEDRARRAAITWLIVGGESGPGARPMHPDWARALRDQCTRAGVAYHFKQWGEWWPVAPVYGVDEVNHRDGFDVDAAMDLHAVAAVAPDGHICSRWEKGPNGAIRADHQPCPGAWYMAKVGKHAAGRTLDGRTFDQYPDMASPTR